MEDRIERSGGKPPVAPRLESVHNKERLTSNPGSRFSGDGAPRTDASGSSGSTSNRSTPKSVVVGSVALSRDLSDLTGSYHHGASSGPSSQAVPKVIFNDDRSSVSSLQKSWRQAYVLSNKAPDVILDELSDMKTSKKKPIICLDESDSVELVRKATNTPALYVYSDSPRIPLLVLLMDASKKFYEFLRIYVDTETDNVRDVLHSVRQNIPDNWKQDYDGLLQIRAGVSSQLIHCLSLQHYDVQPFECWIAKPWSVSAKSAGSIGETLILHLKGLGVLVDNLIDDESIVQLSQAAAARVYEPFGSFDHYHAKDFLTFSPPFESLQWKHKLSSDDQSSRSNHSSKSRGSSLAANLESLREVDESEILEESHEVQTVSSYSHLAAVNIFDSIKEEEVDAGGETPPAAFHPYEQFELKEPYQHDQDEKVSSLKIKGLVGKLWCRSPSSSLPSDGSHDSLLVHTGVKVVPWDLTPMNSNSSHTSFGSSKEDTSQSSCRQPLLSKECTAGASKSSRFRRN